MSIASEITRLQQAKADLATSIANKGVTVPAATTLDGYAALVDSIQGGGEFYGVAVEYLESTGTQWIDTGYLPNINSDIRVVWSPMETSPSGYFGSRSIDTDTTSLSRLTCTTFSSGAQFAFAMSYNGWVSNRFTLTIGAIYDCRAKNGSYSCNGTQYTSTVLTSFTTGQPFLLCRYYSGGTAHGYYNLKMKIYAFQVWESDILKMNLIPVRIGQVGHMYDKISGKVYGNAGTGNFTLGNDVTT